MVYLKLYFNFIKHSIISNPIKILLLIAAYISFNFAGTIKGSYEYIDIVAQYKDKNIYIYVIKNKSTSSGYEILSFDKKQEIKNEQLKKFDYNDVNIILYTVFGLSLLVATFGSFIDRDASWCFYESYQMSISSLIYCELEGDTYFYMILDRLIIKKGNRITSHNIAGDLGIYNMSDVYRLPRFSTKKQNRNNLLDKLGIN
jgi:hypothetical protein